MSTEPLKLWRADRTNIKLVDCPDGTYPASDADGRTVFVNTHFRTAEEAWRKVEAENEAWVSNTLQSINNEQETIRVLKDRLVEACLARLAASKNRQLWEAGMP